MTRKAERGFTLIEIMIVVAIIALLAAIAIPNVLRGRTSANESAAIGNVRALISSVEMFRSVNLAYPDAWVGDMYGACPGGAGAPDPDFGPSPFCVDILAGAAVQGYTYNYDALPAACVGAACTQYRILVTPVNTGRTGTRSFYADDSGTIRHCLEPVSGAVAATVGGMVNDNTIDAGPTDPCA